MKVNTSHGKYATICPRLLSRFFCYSVIGIMAVPAFISACSQRFYDREHAKYRQRFEDEVYAVDDELGAAVPGSHVSIKVDASHTIHLISRMNIANISHHPYPYPLTRRYFKNLPDEFTIKDKHLYWAAFFLAQYLFDNVLAHWNNVTKVAVCLDGDKYGRCYLAYFSFPTNMEGRPFGLFDSEWDGDRCVYLEKVQITNLPPGTDNVPTAFK